MGMNATQLGRLFGRSAIEMNKLLLAHGLVEGGPGAYRPTELGAPFAKSVDRDNGYGGIAARAWGWLTWDDKLVEFLKASIEANPDGIVPAAAPEALVTTIKPAPTAPLTDASGKFLTKNKVFAAAVITTVAISSTPLATRAYARAKLTVSRFRAGFAEGRSSKGDAGEPDASGETEDDSQQ
jgi:hypothetical protein